MARKSPKSRLREACGIPTDEEIDDIVDGGGLVHNHDFFPIDGDDFDDARLALEVEDTLLARGLTGTTACRWSTDPAEYPWEKEPGWTGFWTEDDDATEALADEVRTLCGDNKYVAGLILELDLGVASVVAALAALGCLTQSSCRAGDGHLEPYPSVCCWCTEEQLALIVVAAHDADGTVQVEPLGSRQGILVSADKGKLEDLRNFARALCQLHPGVAKVA